jgi:pSer/pThr/pTyr-binding forkhead associated (FHA) protein
MRYQIECANCGQQYQFTDLSQRPAKCEHCLNPLDSEPVKPLAEPVTTQAAITAGKIAGLILIYQKTGEKIEIKNVTEVILGRENFGQQVLSKVPQVSRRHCQLKIQDNQVWVTDLDSMHGTYIGVDKINCKTQPDSALRHNDYLYLGQELFLVNINYRVKEKPKKVVYRCRNCGFEAENFDMSQKICPNPQCKKYGTIEKVEVEELD